MRHHLTQNCKAASEAPQVHVLLLLLCRTGCGTEQLSKESNKILLDEHRMSFSLSSRVLFDSWCIPFGLLPIMLEIPIETREDLFVCGEGAQKALIQQVFLHHHHHHHHHQPSGDRTGLGLNLW